MKKEIKFITQYIKRNYKYILALFILAIITYSIRLNNFCLTIDSEVTINDISGNSIPWISTGRWALVILGKCVHLGRFNWFYSNILTLIFLVLSVLIISILIARIINNKEKEKKILLVLGCLSITSPVLAEMLCFTMMSAEVTIGICLVFISIYLSYLAIYNKIKIGYLLSILLLAFSMGIYQAFFPLFISIIAATFLIEKIYINNKRNIKEDLIIILKMITVFIGAYLVYTIVNKMLLNHYNLRASTYLTNQINWGKRTIGENVTFIIEFMKSVILPDIHHPIWNYGYLISIVLLIAYIIRLLKKQGKNSILSILCLIFLVLSPFLLTILLGNSVVIRTMMNMPYIIAIIYILLIDSTDKRKKYKYGLIIIIFLITVIQIKSTNDLFYSDYMRYQEDKNMVISIFNKIDNLDNLKEENREKTKVVFIGIHAPKTTGITSRGETMSYSFFEWDSQTELGSNKRVYDFSKVLGYNYIMPTENDITKAKKISEEMGVYPSKNSIFIKDNLVIVKLS